MKKIFLSAALVLAAVAGTVRYYNENENENEMSDLAKANVKALAEEVKMQCFLEDKFWTCHDLNKGVYCVCGLIYEK